MPYTNEQYRKDKKKLIGVGLLIFAFFIFLLNSWNMGQLTKRRVERERIKAEQQAMGIEESPIVPNFGNIFNFDKSITPEMMDEITEKMEEDEVQYKEKKFANFKMTVSSKWQEIKKEELEKVFPEIIYEIDKVNAEILFLAHNFDIEKIVIDMLKRGDIGIMNMPQIRLQEIKLQDIILFNIVKFREMEKVDDFVNVIKEFDEKSEYFKITKKDIVKKSENQIRITAKYSLSQRIDDKIQEIKIYSYKKIVLINEDLYTFIFLSDSELTEENKKIDKILESVIIN